MKKHMLKSLFLWVAVSLSVFCTAATVSLSFSGITTEGRYCLLDSVRIENITRNTIQVLDCEQDTTCVLEVSYAPVGIDNVQDSKSNNGLLSNCQNFAFGNTSFTLSPKYDGVTHIRVIDIVGRIVMEHVEYLCAGSHQFGLCLNAPQTYILSVLTEKEAAATKVVNMTNTGVCDIFHVTSIQHLNSRRAAYHETPDLICYTGYTNQKGQAVASEPLTQYQEGDEHIYLKFAPVEKTQEGMYTAMIGFNSQLYQYSFDRLTTSNLTQHQNFVSNLTMASGTILYHAVYTALDKVVKAPVPQKVENVSLVTFTDGLDIGSWRMNSDYPSEALYLEAVNKQIHRTCIDGVKLDAYAIGVKGSDVTDITRFENDLHQLASEPDNVYSVTNMDEVNAKFREIAAKIYNTKVTYSLTIKLPAPDPGSVIRFTFDNVSDAKNSIYYIEGTYDYDFNNGVGILKNITYSGIRCSNGSTWVSTPSGIFDLFTINNITNSLGEKISTSTMKQWTYISSTQSWQVNSEFSPSSNSTSTEEHSSAIVMLVLDCSSSLSSDFSKMQTAAKTFLGILAGQGDITVPTVSKATFTLGDLQVTMKASVSGTGNLSIIDKGFCVSENQNMDNAKFYSVGAGTANFTYTLNNLVAGRTYYCRPYAENQLGQSFGTTTSFTAIEYTPPTVSTYTVTNITASSANCGGNVTSDGHTSVTERGLCWSTKPNPTINDNVLSLGSGTGSFSGTMQNLTDGTTYYVRAYAKNNKGVGYGAEKSFTTVTIVPPTLTTSNISNITINSAKCGGSISSEGNSAITERGLCWSIKPNPTINDNVLALGSGTGSFSGTMQNLTDGTTYYVRAYAKNSKCIGYGDEKSFTTTAIVPPTLTTSNITDITINSAKCGGSISSEGNSAITERGLCWSIKPNPTINDNVLALGSGTGSFSGTMQNLTDGTTYYVRAYAKNSKCIGYGDEKSFTTTAIVSPTLTTSNITDITDNSAKCGGNILSDGNSAITERGLCWSTKSNPTIKDNVLSLGSGTGSFSGTMENLTAGTIYYVRAYAKNNKCVGYGDEKSFTAVTIVPPTISLLSVEVATTNSAKCTGEIVMEGYPPVLERGFCWSKSSNPTIDDNTITAGSGAGTFTGNITNIEYNTVYYIRAYAKNREGVFYSQETLGAYISVIYYTATSQLAYATSSTAEGIYTSNLEVPILSHTFTSGKGTIVFKGKLTYIADYMFYKCANMSSITIPNSVTSIGHDAFYGCTSLTSITIPNSVMSIGNYAFQKCTGLTSVTIPNSVTSIGNSVLSGCTGLTSVTIPNSVMSIGNYAFSNCTGLTSITIPNSVMSIGNGAFNNCSGLTSVTIPNSVMSIGNYAFQNCTGLTSVTIPNGVTRIGEYAFKGCSSLTSVTIPNSVTSIGDYAFEGCTGLTSVIIPNSVTSIGWGAFRDCTGLTSVTIPNGVTRIGEYAFKGCSSLTSVTIPNSVTSIGEDAFSGCSSLTSVTIPNGVTSIGYDAFYQCTGLTSVTIGNSVTSIGGSAFYGCKNLTSVTIPNSVTSIGAHAFGGCSSLTSVTIGNGVTSIGNGAFHGCSGLTKVNIADLAAWCNIAFDNDNSLPANPLYYAKHLYMNDSEITDLIIPNGVTRIGDYAFYYCKGLTSVSIPNSVIIIGECAFRACSGMVSVTIGNSVTSIGDDAFAWCTGLKSMTCLRTSPPSCASNSFYYVSTSIPVYVPASAVSKYKSADVWKIFTNIKAISE